jgi:hypothetical protein
MSYKVCNVHVRCTSPSPKHSDCPRWRVTLRHISSKRTDRCFPFKEVCST